MPPFFWGGGEKAQLPFITIIIIISSFHERNSLAEGDTLEISFGAEGNSASRLSWRRKARRSHSCRFLKPCRGRLNAGFVLRAGCIQRSSAFGFDLHHLLTTSLITGQNYFVDPEKS